MRVEPINFVRDQLAGDETLMQKRCVSGCSSEVMRPGEAHQDIGAGQTMRAMQTRPTLTPTMHSYSISYALASLAYMGRICAPIDCDGQLRGLPTRPSRCALAAASIRQPVRTDGGAR